MTPKEKAFHLYFKYIREVIADNEKAKLCALIAVDECIESTKQLIYHYTKGDDKKYSDIYLSMSLSVQYWQEVKTEIQKL
jgi:hypothetical protein